MRILTFDIEDWYCHDCESGDKDWASKEVRIYEGVERILDSLAKRNQNATFFVLGWLAENHPQAIRKIADAGHQVGCHTYQHELLTRFDKQQMHEDVYRAKSEIESVIGAPIDAFRAPAFSITENNLYAFDVLAELGFKYDCSLFPAVRDYGGMPSYGIGEPRQINHDGYIFKEFPINPADIAGRKIVFSGGGYFRLFPYWLIKKLTEQQNYTMTYFHPSDFDPGQPDMKHLPMLRRWKNRVGLKGAFNKYEKYLSDFDFVDLAQADKMIDWSSMEEIKL